MSTLHKHNWSPGKIFQCSVEDSVPMKIVTSNNYMVFMMPAKKTDEIGPIHPVSIFLIKDLEALIESGEWELVGE